MNKTNIAKKDPTGGMKSQNISKAYELIRKKDFGGLNEMVSYGNATKEFFMHFSVKALANIDERNNSAGAVLELMQIGGFTQRNLLDLATKMSNNKLEKSNLEKAHDYLQVVMRLVDEVGTPEEHYEVLKLRDRIEYLKTETAKKTRKAASEFEYGNPASKDWVPPYC